MLDNVKERQNGEKKIISSYPIGGISGKMEKETDRDNRKRGNQRNSSEGFILC